MKLEETIQTILDKYPVLFEDRKSVLIYLYCHFGTGYEWIDGELVSDETKGEFKGKLINNIAEQQLTEEESCIKYIYESNKEPNISYSDFVNKVKEIKDIFLNKAMNEYNYSEKKSIKIYEDKLLQPSLNIIRDIRKSYISNVYKSLSKEYSPIYNIPDDIKEDWLQGLKEVKKLIDFKETELF